MFISGKRALWALGLSIILVIYGMNFVVRNVEIMATRTLVRQIFNYGSNILLFFIVFYLLISLSVYIIKLFNKKK